MQKQTENHQERPPVGWLLLIILCAAAFWLGQAVLHTGAGPQPATVPNDLFAAERAKQGAPTPVPQNVTVVQPTPAPQPSATPAPTPTATAAPGKMVCLTFDDGPSASTQQILGTLQSYGVPATFFVVAYEGNQKYLPLVKDIVAQGHQLAMHSASHEYSKIYQSSSAFWLDIKELRQALEPYADIEAVRWLRFPGGSTNTVSHKYGGKSIMKTLIAECAEKGYEWVDWNVSAEDATRKRPDADQILQNIVKDATGRDVCVVLMHDTKATAQTVKALPSVIEWFRDEGYEFLTVEQMYDQRQAASDAPSSGKAD